MKALRDDAISIFTDGSSKQNPRRGGIAFHIVVTGEDGHQEVHDRTPHGYPQATNNEMELQACVGALRFLNLPTCPIDLSRYRRIIIYTDSMYVRKHIGLAISQGSRDKWKRSSGAPVMNAQLWRDLIRAIKAMRRLGLPVDFEWVPGKSSDHTKAVDAGAKDSADRPLSLPLSGGVVRRKRSEEVTDPGVGPDARAVGGGLRHRLAADASPALHPIPLPAPRRRPRRRDRLRVLEAIATSGPRVSCAVQRRPGNPWIVESYDEVPVA